MAANEDGALGVGDGRGLKTGAGNDAGPVRAVQAAFAAMVHAGTLRMYSS